ncbi:hypothetical protein H4R34_003328 [Dimargaris verticillata]|uniref:Uncharacterized protein n=1 Tax=Dimargaris verticillata TaxID=2761393 RepID=A0A9W8B739_9FUNG|nr:hypothetical protein H4R34_003328 [Dimargaris verticillata]
MDFVHTVDSLVAATITRFDSRDTLTTTKGKANGDTPKTVPWGWVATVLLDVLDEYPSGLTRSIILTELEGRREDAGDDQYYGLSKRYSTVESLIDNSATPQSVFEMQVVAARVLPNTQIWVLGLQGSRGSTKGELSSVTHSVNGTMHTLELYLHQKFYFLTTDSSYRLVLQCPRTVRFSGARIVQSAGQTVRILPTTLMLFELSWEALMRVKDLTHHHQRYGTQSLSTPIPNTPNSGQPSPTPSTQTQTDTHFLQTYFAADALSDITPAAVAQGKEFRLWVKVNLITATRSTQQGGHLKKTQIFISDPSTQSAQGRPAALVVWDEQLPLATMLGKGDYLGIYHPTIQAHTLLATVNAAPDSPEAVVELEYGPQTILFFIPRSRQVSATAASSAPRPTQDSQGTSSQTTLPFTTVDEYGVMDCTNYPHRLRVADLQPRMSGVTLVGQIVAASQNMFIEKQGQRVDRFALRVQDETGIFDVTCWESLGLHAAQCRVGEWVLLSNMVTSESNQSHSADSVDDGDGGLQPFFANLSELSQSRVRTIDTRRGFLSCSYLRRLIPLWSACQVPLLHARVVVTGWKARERICAPRYAPVPNDPLGLMAYAHRPCQHSLSLRGTDYYCTVCDVVVKNVSDVTQHLRILWTVDDGTKAWEVEAQWNASQDLLGVSAEEFARHKHVKQHYILNATRGQSYYITMLQVQPSTSPSSQPVFVITAACPADGIMAETQKLCTELTASRDTVNRRASTRLRERKDLDTSQFWEMAMTQDIPDHEVYVMVPRSDTSL